MSISPPRKAAGKQRGSTRAGSTTEIVPEQTTPQRRVPRPCRPCLPPAAPEPVESRVVHCCDNLGLLRAMPAGCIDLVYIDPPFNSNRDYPIDAASHSGRQQAFRDRHASTAQYVAFMRPRCRELVRILKNTGTFFYHCDWHASHYVKVMLDGLFGQDAFINEIVWAYETGGRATHHFSRKHDVVFFYSPGARSGQYTFNAEAVAVPRNTCRACGHVREKRNHLKRHVDDQGRVYRSIRSNGKTYRYYDDEPVAPSDVWTISHLQQKDPQRVGYPTQKPLALLDRIIRVASHPGDLVLDAFCGSGTTLVAAENLGRRWIGIDCLPAACQLAAQRLRDVCRLEEGKMEREDAAYPQAVAFGRCRGPV